MGKGGHAGWEAMQERRRMQRGKVMCGGFWEGEEARQGGEQQEG